MNATTLAQAARRVDCTAAALRLPMNDRTVPLYTRQAAEADMGTTVIGCLTVSQKESKSVFHLFFFPFVITQLCVVIAKKIQKPLSNMGTAAFISGSKRSEALFRGLAVASRC